MKITLSPQRRDDRLAIERERDTLLINGKRFDFSPLKEGFTLPREAVNCEWLVSDVERLNGEIHLTLILPHGQNAPETTRFPSPILNPPDGVVQLPEYGGLDRDQG